MEIIGFANQAIYSFVNPAGVSSKSKGSELFNFVLNAKANK